jgi:hypothetical protein
MNKHVGFPSERLTFKVTIQNVVIRDTEFGTITDHTMVTPDGDVLFWQASAGAVCLNQGDSYTVKATIKTHDIDEDGTRRTIVLRVEQFHEPQRIARVAVGLARPGSRRR